MKILRKTLFVLFVIFVAIYANLRTSYVDYVQVFDLKEETGQLVIKGTSPLFKRCPCCGESVVLKGYDYLTQAVMEHSDLIFKYEIVVCKDCLSTPSKLDPDKVFNNLLREKRWRLEHVIGITEAFKRYKQKKFTLI